MNRYISLDNIFNYIPKSIREAQGDDDQLKSFAMQGLRKINYDDIKYVEDFEFFTLDNHKVKLPYYIKKLKKVELLLDELVSNLDDFLEENPSWDITQFTNNKESIADLWFPMEEVNAKVFDYYCKVEEYHPKYYIYKGILNSSYEHGTLAIHFWREYHENDDILLPENPEQLWVYISSFAEMQHWKDRKSRGEQGAFQQYKDVQMETANYLSDLRGVLVRSHAKVKNAKRRTYGESSLTKLYDHIINEYTIDY